MMMLMSGYLVCIYIWCFIFSDDEQDISEPSNYMSAMLQAGETTCPVCIDPIKHVDPVCIILKYVIIEISLKYELLFILVILGHFLVKIFLLLFNFYIF